MQCNLRQRDCLSHTWTSNIQIVSGTACARQQQESVFTLIHVLICFLICSIAAMISYCFTKLCHDQYNCLVRQSCRFRKVIFDTQTRLSGVLIKPVTRMDLCFVRSWHVTVSITAWLFGSLNVYCCFLPVCGSYHYTVGGLLVDGKMVSGFSSN